MFGSLRGFPTEDLRKLLETEQRFGEDKRLIAVIQHELNRRGVNIVRAT